MPRRFPLAQFSNQPLLVALGARAVAVAVGDEPGRGMRNLSNLALLAWAYQEVTDGVNWFRRLLGWGGVAFSVNQLVRTW
jgi:hypothetical protein